MNVWGTDKANVARLDNGAGIGFDQSYATAWFSNEVGCIKHDYVTELCFLVIASDAHIYCLLQHDKKRSLVPLMSKMKLVRIYFVFIISGSFCYSD